MNGRLRFCPACGGAWPKDSSHLLRSFGWLDDLPRGISVSNINGVIHDAGNGRNRFLFLEVKRIDEQWPPADGQRLMLQGLARQTGNTVRILRGDAAEMAVHRVSDIGIANGRVVEPARFRAWVAEWLATGQSWDSIARLPVKPPTIDLMAEARRIFADWL